MAATRRDFIGSMAAGTLTALAQPAAAAEAPAPATPLPEPTLPPSANDPGAAQQAWRDMLDMLRGIDISFIDPKRGRFDDQEMAAGYFTLVNTINFAAALYLNADPSRTSFAMIDRPSLKILGGNPDTDYGFAPVRGDRRYRIHGRRGEEAYMSFTSHRGERSSGVRQLFVDAINHHHFKTARDGSFEIIVSPDREGLREGENWLKLAPDAAFIVSRTYVLDRTRDRPGRFTIEEIDPVPPVRPTRADIAGRLKTMTQFIRETAGFVVPQPLDKPNEMGAQFRFEFGQESADWATVDNVYARGVFLLRPDEALLVEGAVVPCDYWGIQIWDPFLYTPDSEHQRTSVNKAQVRLGPKGQFRVAIVRDDPKIPGLDWVSTAGERQGTFFVRWLVSQEKPAFPSCRLMKLKDLRETGSRMR